MSDFKVHSAGGTSISTLPGFGSKGEEEELGRKGKRHLKKMLRKLEGKFSSYPHLMAIKPRERYIFRSDYFLIDDQYCAIMAYFHDEGANDDYPAFWGVDRIPGLLKDGVTAVILEQVVRRPQDWVESNMSNSERVEKLDSREQETGGTNKSRRKSAKASHDLTVVTSELLDGASYLQVHSRLLLKAPNLETLERTVETMGQIYQDRFSTLRVDVYHGEQRKELSTLFDRNRYKRGKGFGFTSEEYAGSYHLVTNGLSDPAGEYVGYMVGEVNTGAVLFDVDKWNHHVVIADPTVEPFLNRARYGDMWGSKVGQAALLRNHRVVHIVLNGANLDEIGPKLGGLTVRLDMTKGDINMLEMFGTHEEELAIFPTHLDKIVLMLEQAYATTDSDRSVIRGSLKDTLNQFYIDQRMWLNNAKENRSKLRIVGIPHNQVPRIQDLVTYFNSRYKALSNSTARDDEMLHAYNVLGMAFKDMLDNSGDLFNTYTNDEIDYVGEAQRVIYDFSALLRRGKGVAMAQLVNVIGFAVSNLKVGDVLVIHGAERIDAGIKEYVEDQLDHLYDRGGRVAYVYDKIESMIAEQDFNSFDAADWTTLGPMRDAIVEDYKMSLAQAIPPDLVNVITSRDKKITYLRRGHSNVVFATDLALGVNPNRQEQRVAAEIKSLQRLQAMRVRRQRAKERDLLTSVGEDAEAERLAGVSPKVLTPVLESNPKVASVPQRRPNIPRTTRLMPRSQSPGARPKTLPFQG